MPSLWLRGRKPIGFRRLSRQGRRYTDAIGSTRPTAAGRAVGGSTADIRVVRPFKPVSLGQQFGHSCRWRDHRATAAMGMLCSRQTRVGFERRLCSSSEDSKRPGTASSERAQRRQGTTIQSRHPRVSALPPCSSIVSRRHSCDSLERAAERAFGRVAQACRENGNRRFLFDQYALRHMHAPLRQPREQRHACGSLEMNGNAVRDIVDAAASSSSCHALPGSPCITRSAGASRLSPIARSHPLGISVPLSRWTRRISTNINRVR
jgi:hypothetical protein